MMADFQPVTPDAEFGPINPGPREAVTAPTVLLATARLLPSEGGAQPVSVEDVYDLSYATFYKWEFLG